MTNINTRFSLYNNIIGWVIFFITAITYLSTIEPTASFWDCGEFIASAYKLEVGHAPGAPLFVMLARIFTLFAPNTSYAAMCVNAMSAFASAFTVLFLFFTITHLSRKLIIKSNKISTNQLITILASGTVGALAFAFSDTFWFSASEAEVYATSSLFTAVVFWAILKWEDSFAEPYANRWIVLITYLIGLSIGVHLLNLLAIPAVLLVFYFKKYSPSVWGIIVAIAFSFVLLAGIQYGIIVGVIQLAVSVELMFVNKLGFGFNTGVWVYSVILISTLLFGIWYSYRKQKVLLNTVLLAFAMILLGYSSYSMIVIRSATNTPMNENRPDNVFSLLSYLNRDQYGDRPLLYGHNYNAPITKTIPGKPEYVRESGKYVITYNTPHYEYDSRFNTAFPRMYSSDPSHIAVYKAWANIKGKPILLDSTKRSIEYCPTFIENVYYFVKYQIGYMYFRYFMWNFAGRQNNTEGNGGIVYGYWISGLNVIDNLIVGPQHKLPQYLKDNKGRNRYYFLPLLLGLVGMFYQLKRGKTNFLVVAVLFFMAGIAIVIYLNQTPLQARERDYAYVGSFYAFAIWIGLGALALIQFVNRWLPTKKLYAVLLILVLLAVPALMAFENYNDHNRAGRYTTRDVAYNYLNSCAPNAILFTNGDNDTFPLWYLQEVEGVRTDVRVVNLTLLGTDWYIDQLKRKTYNSKALPISLTNEKYRTGKRDFVYIIEKTENPIALSEAISFVASDSSINKYEYGKGELLDYLPTRNFTLPVNSQLVNANGTVSPKHAERAVAEIPIKISRNYLTKSELLVMDILATNAWKRPIYYTSANTDGTLGLDYYLQLEGFAYRLVPILSKSQGYTSAGRVETSVMYNNLMNKFRYGRMNEPDVLIDDQQIQTQHILHTRINFSRLAEQLFEEGKRDSALQVLNRCVELMPSSKFPPDWQSYKLEETAFAIGAINLGRQLLNQHANKCFNELSYFYAMNHHLQNYSAYERSVAQIAIIRLTDIANNAKQIDLSAIYKKKFRAITGLEMKASAN